MVLSSTNNAREDQVIALVANEETTATEEVQNVATIQTEPSDLPPKFRPIKRSKEEIWCERFCCSVIPLTACFVVIIWCFGSFIHENMQELPPARDDKKISSTSRPKPVAPVHRESHRVVPVHKTHLQPPKYDPLPIRKYPLAPPDGFSPCFMKRLYHLKMRDLMYEGKNPKDPCRELPDEPDFYRRILGTLPFGLDYDVMENYSGEESGSSE